MVPSEPELRLPITFHSELAYFAHPLGYAAKLQEAGAMHKRLIITRGSGALKSNTRRREIRVDGVAGILPGDRQLSINTAG
jgi:hypothetical protein